MRKSYGNVENHFCSAMKLEDDSIENANDKLVSFAFVRDPFDRLVSCYYSKMTMTNWPKDHQNQTEMRWIRDKILTE